MPNSESKTFYDLLGIKADASVKEIRAAFLDQAKKLHPDKAPEEVTLADATQHFVDLKGAYNVLSDPERRTQYDHQLKLEREAPKVYKPLIAQVKEKIVTRPDSQKKLSPHLTAVLAKAGTAEEFQADDPAT